MPPLFLPHGALLLVQLCTFCFYRLYDYCSDSVFHHVSICRHHSKLIDELIPIVQQKLKKGRLLVTKNLVGVDHHVQEIMRKLSVVHRDGQVIEICGSNV